MRDAVGDDLPAGLGAGAGPSGLREEVTALLPNALEVRIDPEFAAPTERRGPAAAAAPTAARPSCSTSTWAPGRSTTRGSRSCSPGCTTRCSGEA